MRTLWILPLVLTSLGCGPSQLETTSLTPVGDSLDLSLHQVDRDTCPKLDSHITATVNGVPTAFSSRGGGPCQQVEITSSYSSTVKGKAWACSCEPAVLPLSRSEAAEVKICDGETCATASWPGPTPLPTAELATPWRAGEAMVVLFTPALPSEELFKLVHVGRGLGTLNQLDLGWSAGAVTVPAHPDNAGGLTVFMNRHETFSPTTCEGFGACIARSLEQSAQVELTP